MTFGEGHLESDGFSRRGIAMTYSDEVLKRVRDPRRAGSLNGEHVGTGEVGTLDEGTVVRIQVRAAGDRIAEARFRVFGCSAAIASASLVAEWLEGAAMAEANAVTTERVVQTLALAPEREHVAQLAVTAAQLAVGQVAEGAEGRRPKAEGRRLKAEG